VRQLALSVGHRLPSPAPGQAAARPGDPRPVPAGDRGALAPTAAPATEFGADALPGLHALPPAVWSEDYQVALIDASLRVFRRIPEVIGEHVWNFADFATAQAVHRPGGNHKGVSTRDRQPKAAAWLLRERWRDDGPA